MIIILLAMLFFKIAYEYRYFKEYHKLSNGNSLYKIFFNQGTIGEYNIFKTLYDLNGIGYYRILTNLYIPKNKKETTEIDLLMIHETGIYIIESKNYSGVITGGIRDYQWTQYLGHYSFRFYNPLMQNLNHINYLIKSLRFVSSKCNLYNIYSVIVFGENSDIGYLNIKSPNLIICKYQALRKKLLKNINMQKKVFNSQEIDSIYNYLKKYSNADSSIRKQHIRDTKKVRGIN